MLYILFYTIPNQDLFESFIQKKHQSANAQAKYFANIFVNTLNMMQEQRH